jgi:hypothetical protein
VEIFYTWLGADVVELMAGGVSWNGLIYEIELTHKGSVRRRSLDLMTNAVNVSYQDGGEVSDAGFSTQAQAIARYGRKEISLSGDNMPLATAQALRARHLAGNAWPWPRPVSLGEPGDSAIEIRACGYVFTANWLYLQSGDGAEHDVDHWISAIAGTAEGLSSDHGGSVSGAGDCQFLSGGNLASNTLQVKEYPEAEDRAWDKIAELADLGDSSGNPWRAWVDKDRRLHYQPVELDPRYYLRDGVLYDSAGGRVAVEPWGVVPGVVRDLSYPVTRSEPGSSLADARDQIVEEVEINAGGRVSLKTTILDEAEAMEARAILEAEQEGAE